MRFKRDCHRGPFHFLSALDDPSEYLLVSDMHTVEITNRHNWLSNDSLDIFYSSDDPQANTSYEQLRLIIVLAEHA